MPSKSEQQRKWIFVQRDRYKSKENTPEDMKWIWKSEWEKIEENNMKRYKPIFKEEFNKNDYLKWKRKNVTYRGIKSFGKDNEVYGSFGKGLYTAPLSNKAMAKTYGDLYFVVNAIPKKPKIVNSLNDAEIVRQGLVANFCKKNNVDYNLSFFEKNTSMDKEMLKLGFDGLIIKGREMVHYNPKDIIYFKTEEELINYYNSVK